MKLKQLLIPLLAATGCVSVDAAEVLLDMNDISTTMTFVNKETKEGVEIIERDGNSYLFEAVPGEYILTGFNEDGTVNNGSIVITIDPEDEYPYFRVFTNTIYATNVTDSGDAWTVENGDYTIDVTVSTREGSSQKVVVGKSETPGRYTFLALSGNTYNAALVPSEAHQKEGYATLYRNGTLTYSVNVTGAIPQAGVYSISVPADAEFQLGLKFSHFVDFTTVEPMSVETTGDAKIYKYNLAFGQVYNYRTWMDGGLTQGGYFYMAEDPERRPELKFTEADYKAFDPKQINHDVNSNQGYETGNILLNINERGHLTMNVGDEFAAHAMRSWELTDNSTNNYFIEPDFHYTVVGLDGKPSTGVIEIAQTPGSAWADIKAVGNGTAIVLATYDAIGLNFYSSSYRAGQDKSPYMGGEYWGAIWPENTGVFVVTVGKDAAAITPNMVINEKYNLDTKKLAGKYVDAEHDVFYYLDTEDGISYTFAPEGVDNVTIAYPTIGEQMATYSGFGAEGVTKNEDGSYTLLLKHGRNIVRMTDASGKSVYQILNAKPCHREIINASREWSKTFQPGDEVKIQYSGLHHPANKLAGIYNMSAYVTYNGVPNGSSLILGSGQYTFGSAASAQAVTVTVPEDLDVTETPELVMNEGVIQVNGYGDPIGNHRNISRTAGRNPNFTALPHKTYFGYLPDVAIPLTAYKEFIIKIEGAPVGTEIVLSTDGNELTADADGTYRGTYGTYSLMTTNSAYRCYRNSYEIGGDAEGEQIFRVEMVKVDGPGWDGKIQTEPQLADNVYQIGTPAELAWFADYVSVQGNADTNGCLTADIDLGDYEWWPTIGVRFKTFNGSFDGQGYKVSGLYINKSDRANYWGLFGALEDATVSNMEVHGQVTGSMNYGGIIGYADGSTLIKNCENYVTVNGWNGNAGGVVGDTGGTTAIDRCANHADVESTIGKAAGVVGSLSAYGTISNCYNTGDITGLIAGGLSGTGIRGHEYNNLFNTGIITGDRGSAGAIAPSDWPVCNNCFSTVETTFKGYELVTDAQMRSGEVAYKLGEAFGQEIGKDEHPVIGGMKVLYDEKTDTYYNDSTSGIEDVMVSESEGAVYYNLQGVASDRPFKGMNIIRLSDGTTHKVFIK